MSVNTQADWCETSDTFAICGTNMREHSRQADGEPRWCFTCRKVRSFMFVVTVPDGMSYYGPNAGVECSTCQVVDADLFPGRYREWEE